MLGHIHCHRGPAPEGIMLNEISQMEEEKCPMISHICGI